MIIIFSNTSDSSAKKTMQWLNFINEPFLVIGEDKFTITSLQISNSNEKIMFRCGNIECDVKDIQSIWYRSEFINIKDMYYNYSAFVKEKNLQQSIQTYLSDYWFAQKELLEILFSEKKTIGKNNQGRFNKPIALRYAAEICLDIPNTIFTNNKKDLEVFIKNHNEIIAKSFDLAFSFYSVGESIMSYTSKITISDLLKIPSFFEKTLFQELIPKQYEIRTFFLNNVCYSTAIISQNNEKTLIDYRRYDKAKMNRSIPYKLPSSIENKITLLMKKCGLSSGSIDLIKSTDGRFVFLEVNPVGQFGYHSYNCNYNLHKQIAEYLSKRNDNE
ncbi:MAG: hypothetical protein RL708_399 [Bacteroidota bacterium]|jgi:ATP-GRASP peptide maturase of grasp-with-spasm system